MSGHSHWHSIKYRKGVADAKKSKVFSKMIREIAVVAREGDNPELNSKLKLVIEKAKSVNMPAENIERAIKKGAGKLDGEKLETVNYEAYGPGGIAIIIEGITDNKNRSLNEIKQILSQNNGKLAEGGSVKWLFEKKGVIIIENERQTSDKEGLELKAIEAGADDTYWRNNTFGIYTKPEELGKAKKYLENKGILVGSASLDWVAKETIDLKNDKDEESCQKLFEALDENDAVQEIYSNLRT